MIIRAALRQPDRTDRDFTLTVGTRSPAIFLCVWLAAFCLSPLVKAQERTIAHVLDVEGDWYLDGRPGQALSKSDELPASGVVRVRSPSRYAFIIIQYSDNKRTISKRCRNSGECAQPILLPRAVHREASYWEIFTEILFGSSRRNPVTGVSNAGRSDDGTLREAVVRIKDGQVDLAPVFTEMNNGTYDMRLKRRMPDGKMADVGSANSIKVKWASGTATTTTPANLQPGLYEIVLLEKRGAEYKPTLTTAWFLAGNLEQYADAVAPFCEATRLTASWKDDVSEGTARGYLRAFLIHLASESRPAQPAK